MPEITPSLVDTQFTRRAFLAMTAAGGAALAARGAVVAQPRDGKLPVTGAANPDLEPFDKLMTSFIEQNDVPGASLAVARHGKLVYARGFGYASLETKRPVRPVALFRICSVSKPITSVAVMQLIEKGKLKLDDKVTDRMEVKPFVAPGAKPDPRWKQITVRHCLQHSGGWDRGKSYDPMCRPWEIAKALGMQPPLTPVDIVRFMMGQPLDFDPGEREAYSNFGYLVLGRIIEAVTEDKYEAYVKRAVLAPLGITRMRLGRALFENRAIGEVRYYDGEKRMGPALYPPRIGRQVPFPYGAEIVEAFEAPGGWIASAVDLVKFAAAFDDPARCPILGARAIREMWARPSGLAGYGADGKPKPTFYACGWQVRPSGKRGKCNAWHFGGSPGATSGLVHRWDGMNWAALFNTDRTRDGKSPMDLIDGRIHEAADSVKAWPDTDLFGTLLPIAKRPTAPGGPYK
jgi:N-acyl-D-amino-acid deacylase